MKSELVKWKTAPPTAASLTELIKSIQPLGHPPEEVDIPFLLEQSKACLNELSIETLALLYYWCCKSQVGTAEFLARIAQQIAENGELDTCALKHRVLMIYGTGWLVRHRNRGRIEDVSEGEAFYEGMHEFIDRVAQSVTAAESLIHLKEQDLSNLVYSLGLLKYTRNEVVEPLLHQIEKPKHLPRFLEQELSNILLGMASLKFNRHPTVAILAAEIVERERLRMYKEPELTSIFYSFVTLGYNNPDAIAILLKETIKSARMPVYQEYQLSTLIYAFDRLDIRDTRLWRQLIKEVLQPHRLPKFEAHHIANILYAIGRLDIRDSMAVNRIMEEATKDERLPRYSTREYSLLLYGVSRSDYRNRVALRKISQELATPGRLKEKGLGAKSLSGILLSLATIGHNDADLVHRYFMEVLHEKKMAEMEPDILAQYIFSLGKLKAPLSGPAKSVVRAITDSPQKLGLLTQRGIGMLIYGLGQMGDHSQQYIQPVLKLLDNDEGTIERFSIQDLAMIIYSFGLMKLAAPEIVDRMVLTFTRPDRIHKASTQHLSNLVYGLGQMRAPIKNVCLEMLEQELILLGRIRQYTNQELANLVFSIGLLNLEHRPGMQNVIEKLTEECIRPERLPQFREMELNCLLTGLSHLHYREPEVLVPVLEETVQPTRLEQWKEAEIASIIHVIAHLGVCPDEICEKLLTEAQRPERLEMYDRTSIVMMVYSIGRMHSRNFPEVMSALTKQILKSDVASKLEEQQLANLLYGIAHARHDSPEVLRLIFHEITQHHRLPRFNGGEILNIMKSVMSLKGRNVEVEGLDHVARIFAIEMAAISRIPRYTPSQLTHVLQVLASLRNKNTATLFPILNELAQSDKLHHLSPIDVSRAVFSVGPMAFVNRELHPKLALATKPLLKQVILGRGVEALNCQGIMEMIVGLSMLGLQDKYVLDNLSNEIIRPARLRSFRAWHLSRMFYAVAQLRYHNDELIRALAAELSRQDRAQRLDYRHWSNILTAVLMLRFKDEGFAKLIEKQIHMPQYRSKQETPM